MKEKQVNKIDVINENPRIKKRDDNKSGKEMNNMWEQTQNVEKNEGLKMYNVNKK